MWRYRCTLLRYSLNRSQAVSSRSGRSPNQLLFLSIGSFDRCVAPKRENAHLVLILFLISRLLSEILGHPTSDSAGPGAKYKANRQSVGRILSLWRSQSVCKRNANNYVSWQNLQWISKSKQQCKLALTFSIQFIIHPTQQRNHSSN